METSYFSITSNESVTPEKIGELLSEKFEGSAQGICITEIPKTTKQQPSMPIQFVWNDGYLYHEDSLRNRGMPIEENCTVEQIGAVLYVRGK